MTDTKEMREKMLGRFTDAELASVGLTREQVMTGDIGELSKKVEKEAFEQFDEQEIGIEAVVDMALEKLAAYPNQRMEAFAALWGQAQQDVGDGHKDGEHMFQLFVFAVFKLAETYRSWEEERVASGAVDGNTRGMRKT